MDSKVIGLGGAAGRVMPVSPGLVEVPLGSSCTLFSFSVRSKDVPRPLDLFNSWRWFVSIKLTCVMSCRLNAVEVEVGLDPRSIAGRGLPPAADATIAILFAEHSALFLTFSPLLLWSSVRKNGCSTEAVDASGQL